MNDLDPVKTDDGSSTLFSTHFSSHYHSLRGAKNESDHIYVLQGLAHYITKHSSRLCFSILEYGFGTGLNAILTHNFVHRTEYTVYYKTLEAYPVFPKTVQELNFNLLPADQNTFLFMHQSSWNADITINSSFTLHKKNVEFETFDDAQQYDIIYYDAFCPNTQPHLWEEIQMKKCYDLLVKGGILVTFSAKGSFKRALRSVGFEVERLPGPPGKREMTRATKI